VTWIPEPTERHRALLANLIPETGNSERVPDAHLAALALEYGLILHSTDRDFARFTGLRWRNPLELSGAIVSGGSGQPFTTRSQRP
jgi:hypothetical protein